MADNELNSSFIEQQEIKEEKEIQQPEVVEEKKPEESDEEAIEKTIE